MSKKSPSVKKKPINPWRPRKGPRYLLNAASDLGLAAFFIREDNPKVFNGRKFSDRKASIRIAAQAAMERAIEDDTTSDYED